MKKLFLALLLFPTIAFAKNVPLFETDVPELGYVKLKPHYKVSTWDADDISQLGVKNAVEQWNKAAKKDFIEYAPPNPEDSSPNIYVIPMHLGWTGGVALVMNQDMCVVLVSYRYAYNIGVIMHEIGHCIGFAHDTTRTDSIMHPNAAIIEEYKAIDNSTAKTLRNLLKDL